MAWQPWSAGNPGIVPTIAGLPPVVNPAPAVLPTGSQYTPEQWAQMQHQNWQQWAQWQQQYQQWHQQYGAEYQKSITALSEQTTRTSFQPPIPNTSVPPPLPKEVKPPLPPEEPPREQHHDEQGQNKNFNAQDNFMSGPPPLFNTAPPPSQPPFKAGLLPHNQPPPNIRSNKGGNYNYNKNQNRPPMNQSQYGDASKNTLNKSDYPTASEKRPFPQQTCNEPKKTKVEDASQRSPANNSNEDLSETEKKFIKQFTEWEAQFNKWKAQNMNHPDKEQYKEYEKKWEAWRTQLLERREQMRRKRLGLDNRQSPDMKPVQKQPSSVAPLLPPPFNKDMLDTSKPPPLIHKDSVASKDLTITKESNFSIPNSSSAKEMNKDEFTHDTIDDMEDESSFLKLSKANDGIPGLDLVEDDQKGDEEKEKSENVINLDSPRKGEDPAKKMEERSPDKGPDLEAISKGINNILGDQKLLSMLSMVSQNQVNQIPSASVDTMSKIPASTNLQSNLKTSNEGSNHGWSNTDDQHNINNDTTNYDDQTSSFGGRGGGDSQWQYNKGSYGNQSDFNSINRGGVNAGNQDDFNPGTQSGFNPGNQGRFNSGNQGGFNSGNQGGFNSGNQGGFNSGNQGGFNSGNQGGFNSGNQGFNSGMNDYEKNFGNNNAGYEDYDSQDIHRGHDSFENRDSNNFRGQDNFGQNRNYRGPDNFRGGAINFRDDKGPGNLRAPNNFRGPDNFRGPQNFRGPNNFRGPDNFRGLDNFQGPDNSRGSDNSRGPNNFRGSDNFQGSDNFTKSQENYKESEQFKNSSFRSGGLGDNNDRQCRFEPPPSGNFRLTQSSVRFEPPRDDQGDNYRNFDDYRRQPGDFQDRDSDYFRQGNNENFSEQGNFRGRNFNRNNLFEGPNRRGPDNYRGAPDFQDPSQQNNTRLPSGDLNRPFDRGSNFQDRFQDPNAGFQGRQDGDFDRHSNIDDGHVSKQGFGSFVPPDGAASDAGDPKLESNVNDANENEAKEKEEPLWQPTNIIEYDHKSSKEDDSEISLDPLRTFDYRHKSVNRIPFPQRPEWLVNFLKKFPDFDFVLPRTYNQQPYKQPPYNQQPYNRYTDRYDRNTEGRYENRWNNREPAITRRPMDESNRSSKRFDDYGPSMSRRPHDTPTYPRMEYESKRDYEPKKDFDTKKDYESKRDYDGKRDYETRRDYDTKRDYETKRDYDMKKDKDYDMKRDYDMKKDYEIKKEYDRKIEDVEMIDDDDDDDQPEDFFTKKTDNEKFSPMQNKPRTSNITLIQDILNPPGRYNRPARIVIILRGPPGSGKTFLAKLIKDKEVENGGSAPRILSLDDYFMVEQEKEVEIDNKKTKVKEMVYEYEECMENTYRASLFKAFKKTVTDGYFPFIIVDNVNDKVKYFGEMWSFAKQNGFQVYICQMEFDLSTCTKRNIHNRSEVEIERLIAGWEPTPTHHPTLDATSLIQSGSIPEVEMEEINSPPSEDYESQEIEDRLCRSKWDNFDCSIDNLAKLDGTSKPLRHSRTMEDYLQCDDDEWVSRETTKPGQKRVRWADLEERKKQEKMRAIGFVVGQTNWDRMLDPTLGSSALTQTKYIERVGNPRFYKN